MTKIKHNKAWEAIQDRAKLPRKVKKAIFGNRISKKRIREMIARVEIENGYVVNGSFCPKC